MRDQHGLPSDGETIRQLMARRSDVARRLLMLECLLGGPTRIEIKGHDDLTLKLRAMRTQFDHLNELIRQMGGNPVPEE